uniref:Uncharacterized protein n=1 Tax=Anguilla anguilla TaxID=7936 RepID=A0A0E9QY30_ANGAN
MLEENLYSWSTVRMYYCILDILLLFFNLCLFAQRCSVTVNVMK